MATSTLQKKTAISKAISFTQNLKMEVTPCHKVWGLESIQIKENQIHSSRQTNLISSTQRADLPPPTQIYSSFLEKVLHGQRP
jgi:hypothetical protein